VNILKAMILRLSSRMVGKDENGRGEQERAGGGGGGRCFCFGGSSFPRGGFYACFKLFPDFSAHPWKGIKYRGVPEKVNLLFKGVYPDNFEEKKASSEKEEALYLGFMRREKMTTSMCDLEARGGKKGREKGKGAGVFLSREARLYVPMGRFGLLVVREKGKAGQGEDVRDEKGEHDLSHEERDSFVQREKGLPSGIWSVKGRGGRASAAQRKKEKRLTRKEGYRRGAVGSHGRTMPRARWVRKKKRGGTGEEKKKGRPLCYQKNAD